MATGKRSRCIRALLCVLALLVGGQSSLRNAAVAQAAGGAVLPAHGPMLAPGLHLELIQLGPPEWPRPVRVHVLRVDLATPGLRFAVPPIVERAEPADPQPANLPPGAELPGLPHVRATTATIFLEESAADTVVNAQGVTPWRDRGPLRPWYPHAGQPSLPTDFLRVRKPHPNAAPLRLGPPIKPGQSLIAFWSATRDAPARVVITQADATGHPPAHVSDAPLLMAGWKRLVQDGRLLQPTAAAGHANPRTAFGITADSQTLVLAVLDGRQPGISEGLTLNELARLIHTLHCHDAVNMDGGGSSTLAILDQDPVAGTATRLINRPIHNGVPGRQRPQASFLAIDTTPAGPTSPPRSSANHTALSSGTDSYIQAAISIQLGVLSMPGERMCDANRAFG